jgi:hypothetical protein
MLFERLEHIKQRMEWSKPIPGLSVYARGFSCGNLHRLIAERYFLESLIEAAKEVDNGKVVGNVHCKDGSEG